MNWHSPKSIIGDVPPSVSKHSLTVIGSKFYLFGGCSKEVKEDSDRIYVFDSDNFSWSKKKTHGATPSYRQSHTATAVGERIFIIGGGQGTVFYNDLYIFDTKTLSWNKPTRAGTQPPPRRAHSATLIGSKIYVFGGGDQNGKALNDTWVLDTEKLSWTQLATTNTPAARGFHTAAASGSKLLIFGGTDTKDCFSDVVVLDIERKSWSRPKVIFSFPRLGHGSALIGNWLFVVGGCDGADSVDTVNILNLETLEWTKKTIMGTPPSKRAYHTITAFDSRLWLFGGQTASGSTNDLHLLDLGAYAYLPTVKRAPKI